MKAIFQSYWDDFTHLFFPHFCLGCFSNHLANDALLCTKCYLTLPETGYIELAENPLKKMFTGRLELREAVAGWNFTKDSLLQELIHRLKYRNHPEIGVYLGVLLGELIVEHAVLKEVDVMIPVPLNERKERIRGYNQALMICIGLNKVLKVPIEPNGLKRKEFTETQTHLNVVSRLENIHTAFEISKSVDFEGKHVLLVDDVVTTGATIEACGRLMLAQPNTSLSIAAIAKTLD